MGLWRLSGPRLWLMRYLRLAGAMLTMRRILSTRHPAQLITRSFSCGGRQHTMPSRFGQSATLLQRYPRRMAYMSRLVIVSAPVLVLGILSIGVRFEMKGLTFGDAALTRCAPYLRLCTPSIAANCKCTRLESITENNAAAKLAPDMSIRGLHAIHMHSSLADTTRSSQRSILHTG